MTRKELLSAPEFWLDQAQNELFRQLKSFMDAENLNQTELAKKLGVSKGYVSQILNGNFNYTLRKLIELSLAIGLVPVLRYEPLTAITKRGVKSRKNGLNARRRTAQQSLSRR